MIPICSSDINAGRYEYEKLTSINEFSKSFEHLFEHSLGVNLAEIELTDLKYVSWNALSSEENNAVETAEHDWVHWMTILNGEYYLLTESFEDSGRKLVLNDLILLERE